MRDDRRRGDLRQEQVEPVLRFSPSVANTPVVAAAFWWCSARTATTEISTASTGAPSCNARIPSEPPRSGTSRLPTARRVPGVAARRIAFAKLWLNPCFPPEGGNSSRITVPRLLRIHDNTRRRTMAHDFRRPRRHPPRWRIRVFSLFQGPHWPIPRYRIRSRATPVASARTAVAFSLRSSVVASSTPCGGER